MSLRDQFDKLRNYFIEEDYEDEDEVLKNSTAPRPMASTSSVQSNQNGSHPSQRPLSQQPVQQQQRPAVSPSPRPVQQRQTPSPSNVHRSIGGNSGMNPAYVSKANPQSTVLSRATTTPGIAGSSKITMTVPHVYSDIMDMANVLKSGTTIIVNFKNMGDQQARRSIDFLTGIVYVLDGDIRNIGGQSFLVTPSGVSVDGAKESLLSFGGQGFEGLDLTVN